MTRTHLALWLVLGFVVAGRTASFPRFQDHSAAAEKGQNELKALEVRSTQNICFRGAIAALEESCQSMALNDDNKSHLAIMLANCHLEKSGRRTSPCNHETMTVQECTEDMGKEAFLVYTQFFTHVDSICFYYQSLLWQEQTEQTVTDLYTSTADVASKIARTAQVQELLLENQVFTLETSKKIREEESELLQSVSKTTEHLVGLQQGMGSLEGNLQTVIQLQKLTLGEVYDIKAILFYVAAVILWWLLTATPHTAAARLWIFLLLAANVGLEYYLIPRLSPQSLQNWLWFSRKTFSGGAIFLLLFSAVMYRDLTRLNHAILVQLRDNCSDANEKLFIAGYIKGCLRLRFPAHILSRMQVACDSEFDDSEYEPEEEEEDEEDEEGGFMEEEAESIQPVLGDEKSALAPP